MIIIPREDWGAKNYAGRPGPQPYYYAIVIHHAAGYESTDLETSKLRMRQIQHFHQTNEGWDDIGYHYVVDGVGSVFQGRPYVTDEAGKQQLVVGAHVAGQNTGKVGICVLGDYEGKPGEEPDVLTRETYEALVELCTCLCQTYDIPSNMITGHCDYQATRCPGKVIYERLGVLRDMVSSRLRPLVDIDDLRTTVIRAAVDCDDTATLTEALHVLQGTPQ